MGLDMYLNKAKKLYKDITLEEILNMKNYFYWKRNYPECKDDDPRKWGITRMPTSAEIEEWLPYYGMKEIVYWRKANAIHKYFVDCTQNGIDECKYSEVPREVIEDLRDRCNTILESDLTYKTKPVEIGYSYKDGERTSIMRDHNILVDSSLAQTLLPTSGGFFFGSTDYDEYYIEQLKYTRNKMNEILKQDDFDTFMYIYDASW